MTQLFAGLWHLAASPTSFRLHRVLAWVIVIFVSTWLALRSQAALAPNGLTAQAKVAGLPVSEAFAATGS